MMRGSQTHLIIHLPSIVLLAAEVAAQFGRIPESKVVYLGQNVHFYCSVDSHFLEWTVDGIEARSPQIQARSISQAYSGPNSGSSILTILATKQNNNSEIFCIQQHLATGEELARTSPVYLRIQGLLSAPSIINVETTQSTILLVWIPPFSLINITTYIVTITNEASVDVTSQNTSVPYFWKVDHGYCRRLSLIFEIAAANPVGVGNRTAPINASFHRPFVVVDPSNHTSVANCTIQCSHTELITWFVNGLPLPAFEAELHFRRYPKTPYCSQQHSMSSETHTLSILTLNRTLLSAPLVVYCAVVTVCNKGASNCSEHTCFSEDAYLEPADDTISTSISTPTTSEYNLNSGGPPIGQLQEHSVIPSSHQFLLRTSLGLGATLSVLIMVILSLIITVAIVGCCWHRRKHKRHAVESLYDLPMDPKRRPRASDVDVDSNVMQPCPAYERPERCMRMCGNSH